MAKIEIGGALHPVEECKTCGRTVLVTNESGHGWVSSCGRRLVNLIECGQADDTCMPEQPK